MPQTRKDITILIIEDDIDIQTFAFRVLELEGYNVLKAEAGSAGLKLLHDNHVNLVLLDIKLPDTDGWSMLEHIKADPVIATIPVIIFTASVGISQSDRAIAAGAAAYLTKPINVTTLRNAITRNLKP
jgi:two-component system sensor histidine kinase/response regulator